MEILEKQDTLTRVRIGAREILLIGTAHVSRESVEEVKNIIRDEEPGRVCVELDIRRYKTLKEGSSWENLDIYKIIKTGQGFFFLANLAMSAFQKKIGAALDVKPGEEMKIALETAVENNIPFTLADRDIQITLKRAWKRSGFLEKIKMLSSLISSVFTKEKISEKEVEELKKRSALEDMMHELAGYLPSAKSAIIDERDQYLAAEIFKCKEEKVLAVLGAGHIPGILRYFEIFEKEGSAPDLSPLETLPPKSLLGKIVPWLIPALFVAIVAAGFFRSGLDKSVSMLTSWIVVNGTLASLGSLIALAHPVTIIASFVAAPITSVNPTIGVGIVTGILESILRKPRVSDFMGLSDDILSVKGFFRNRITHIFLVFFLSSVGSSIGTIIVFPCLLALLK